VRAGTKIRFVSGGPGWLQAYSREATAYYGLAAVLNARMQISSGPLPKINQLEKTDVIPSPQKCWVHVGHRVKTVCSSSSIEFWVNILWVTGIIKDELWRRDRSDQPVGVAPFACLHRLRSDPQYKARAVGIFGHRTMKSNFMRVGSI
jgi:hypothetical protein